MTDTAQENISPFVPGARVAVDDGYGHWRESFVEKTYKSGRFTLRDGGDQQWRPSSPSPSEFGYKYWRANKTGSGHNWRVSLRVWDAAADAEINEKLAAQKRLRRWRELRERFERLRESELTDAMLDSIEAALPPKIVTAERNR